MHKGEFYALLPKDAKDIQCTIEVFKTQSTRRRSKPRTVSFEGREDDEAKSIVTNNSAKVARYVVPSRRQEYIDQAASNDSDVKKDTKNMTGTPAVQIVLPQEVKPTFRTPCRYLMIGTIKIKV
jgi:hypothetical protein